MTVSCSFLRSFSSKRPSWTLPPGHEGWKDWIPNGLLYHGLVPEGCSVALLLAGGRWIVLIWTAWWKVLFSHVRRPVKKWGIKLLYSSHDTLGFTAIRHLGADVFLWLDCGDLEMCWKDRVSSVRASTSWSYPWKAQTCCCDGTLKSACCEWALWGCLKSTTWDGRWWVGRCGALKEALLAGLAPDWGRPPPRRPFKRAKRNAPTMNKTRGLIFFDPQYLAVC